MYLFKPKCIFSNVEGIVLEKGKPVEGADVEQYYLWKGRKPAVKIVTTGKQGRFSFPSVYRRSIFASALPFFRPSIMQKITVQYQGKSYKAYRLKKRNYRKNGELNRPLELICDIKEGISKRGGFYGVGSLK